MAVLTPTFPAALDTLTTLGRVSNFATTTVGVGGVDAVATTVPITTTTEWPSDGVCVIGTEAISYTGKTGTSITGCVRGFDGTTAATHAAGDPAYGGVILSAHHEALRDAIIALETVLGPNGADLITTLNGLYVWRDDYNAKGDLLVATAPGVYTNLGVGADGTKLTADPAAASGLSWQTDALPEGGWTPALLGSSVLKGWFRADAITGATDGNPIAQWDDVSGNGNHAVQAVGANQPLYQTNVINSLPAVEFPSNDRMVTPVSGSENDELVLAVVTVDVITGASRTLVGSSLANGRAIQAAVTSGLIRCYGNGSIITTSSLAVPAATPAIWGAVIGPTSNTALLNGQTDTDAHAGTFAAGLTTSIGTLTGDASTSPMVGSIAELIIVQPAPSTANRQRIEGYLAHKYGIALAVGHPYETEAPQEILPITGGGTNAETAAGARTNLGLAIGTDVQPYDANWPTGGAPEHFFAMAADGSDRGITISDLFGANTGVPYVAAARYLVEAFVWYSRTTAGTVIFSLVGTTNFVNVDGMLYHSPAAGMATTATSLNTSGIEGITGTLTAAFPATPSQTLNTFQAGRLWWIVETNATTPGNFRIRVTNSAGAFVLQRGSFFTVKRLPAGNTGTFVA